MLKGILYNVTQPLKVSQRKIRHNCAQHNLAGTADAEARGANQVDACLGEKRWTVTQQLPDQHRSPLQCVLALYCGVYTMGNKHFKISNDIASNFVFGGCRRGIFSRSELHLLKNWYIYECYLFRSDLGSMSSIASITKYVFKLCTEVLFR